MKLAIGSDHAGYETKETVKEWLESQNYEVDDFGTHSTESCDYPDFTHPVAEKVEAGVYEFGIVLCGSANGTCMTANKHQKIRAALCWNEEVSKLAREHNNANMLCIPARFVDQATAIAITKTFLATNFEGGRHENRVEKISLKGTR